MGLFHHKNRRIEQSRHKRFNNALASLIQKLPAIGRQLPIILAILVLASLGVWAGSFVSKTPYFNLKQVDIEGTRLLSGQELLKTANIRLNEHLLHTDTELINDSLSKNPWIIANSVKVDLPDRIHIKIKERVPEAMLLMGELYLIDGDGYVISRASDRPDLWNMPVISGIDRELFLNPDLSVQANEKEKIRAALELLRLYNANPWLMENIEISEIHTDRIMGFSMVTMGDKTTVQLGHSDFNNRLARLEYILRDLRARGEQAASILLDNDREPDRVVVRLFSQNEKTSMQKEETGRLPR